MPQPAAAVQALIDRASGHAQRGSFAPAAEAFRDAIAARPDIADLRHNHGFVLLKLGRFEEAAGTLERAIDLSTTRADTHALLGDALVELDRHDVSGRARSSYERAVALAPRMSRVYIELGELALLDSPTSVSLRWLRLGATADERDVATSARAWFLLGTAQRESGGMVEEAVASLQKAERLEPGRADTHWQLGEALSTVGEPAAALRRFGRAISLAPDHVEAYSALARVAAYEVDSEAGRRAAMRAYRAALRVAPSRLETLHNLGEHWQADGQPARAAVAFRAALRAQPRSGLTHLNLGQAYQMQCRMAEARGHYERAACLLPRMARAQVRSRGNECDVGAVPMQVAVQEGVVASEKPACCSLIAGACTTVGRQCEHTGRKRGQRHGR